MIVMRENDIVEQLRQWTHSATALPASDLMDQAAIEIENLRAQLEASLVVHLRLTGQVLEAVERGINETGSVWIS